MVTVRKGQLEVQLDKGEFRRRFLARFTDPANEVPEALVDSAWHGYNEYRKWPLTEPAGPGFHDPEFPVATEWLRTRKAIEAAQARHADPNGRPRVLLVNGSDRNDQTCPGEMSKTHRLLTVAQETLHAAGFDTEVLDLSRLTSEFGRNIHPCKACVSTAMPLCHWPCSCYPNYAMGQVNDWMNEIYPMWVAAHGVMILTPVYWHSPPGGLKVMMDRLVCADGGNPDPTTTKGKDPQKAKEIELAGWPYPRHLEGRRFAVVVHGDAAGAETVRRILNDWLTDMHLVSTEGASMDRYVGYYEPYATSHEALDKDGSLVMEVRESARLLGAAVHELRERGPLTWKEERPK